MPHTIVNRIVSFRTLHLCTMHKHPPAIILWGSIGWVASLRVCIICEFEYAGTLYSFHALHRSKVSALMTFYRVIAIAMIISRLGSINKIRACMFHIANDMHFKNTRRSVRCIRDGFRCDLLSMFRSVAACINTFRRHTHTQWRGENWPASCASQIDSMATIISQQFVVGLPMCTTHWSWRAQPCRWRTILNLEFDIIHNIGSTMKKKNK